MTCAASRSTSAASALGSTSARSRAGGEPGTVAAGVAAGRSSSDLQQRRAPRVLSRHEQYGVGAALAGSRVQLAGERLAQSGQAQVPGQEMGVDGLGDLDERHHTVQRDQREAGLPGGLDHGGRQRAERTPQLHHQGGDIARGQRMDVRRLGSRARPDQAQTGGQQDLAAAQ